MAKTNRRRFVALSTAITAGMLSGTAVVGAGQKKSDVLHQVYFWLKHPDSEADKAKLIAGLKGLVSIKLIKKLYVGLPAQTEKRSIVDSSWDVSLLTVFADVESEAAYVKHPVHQEFLKNHSDLWAKVQVYDTLEV